ncbi:MAG: hypothetical protein CMB75_02580 [Euryarchaeota archaeon]|nr:hypothetical protein [Euryarchaeota archaeon]
MGGVELRTRIVRSPRRRIQPCSHVGIDVVDIRIDLTGHLCPIPVHETRRAMEAHSPGAVIEIFSDDPESLHDIPALCERRKAECKHELLENGIILFRIVIPHD